jgi:hypothetical protein
MPHANVRAGVWFRNARWPNGTQWRTDIPVSVFADPFVRAARFALSDGPVVQIPMEELRRALAHAPERDAQRKIGPFNIDPFSSVVEVLGHRSNVQMQFGPFHDFEHDEIRRREVGYVSRPPTPDEFFRMADIVLERIHSSRITFAQFVERVQELNPALIVHRSSDGAVSRSEIAYALRVNHLRALKTFEEELLYDTPPNA